MKSLHIYLHTCFSFFYLIFWVCLAELHEIRHQVLTLGDRVGSGSRKDLPLYFDCSSDLGCIISKILKTQIFVSMPWHDEKDCFKIVISGMYLTEKKHGGDGSLVLPPILRLAVMHNSHTQFTSHFLRLFTWYFMAYLAQGPLNKLNVFIFLTFR